MINSSFRWSVIASLVVVYIITISALALAIAAREGKLLKNSIGNDLIKNNQKFIFRGVTVEGNTTLGEDENDKLIVNPLPN